MKRAAVVYCLDDTHHQVFDRDLDEYLLDVLLMALWSNRQETTWDDWQPCLLVEWDDTKFRRTRTRGAVKKMFLVSRDTGEQVTADDLRAENPVPPGLKVISLLDGGDNIATTYGFALRAHAAP